MSNKPIIDIEINADQFKAFYEMFQKYEAALEAMPNEWKQANKATADARDTMTDFQKVTGAAKDQLALAATQAALIGTAIKDALSSQTKMADSLKDSVAAQKELVTVLREGGIQMDKMAGAAGKLGGGAFGAAGHLAGGNGVAALESAIGAIGNLIPGLGKIVALVGGVGIGAIAAGKKLADDAVGDQRSARGLGVSTGQLRSFDLNFGRYVDPSILNTAANAQGDLSMMPYAQMATGQSWQQIQGEDAGQMSMALVKQAHDWWKKTPVTMRNRQMMSARGFDKFFSFEDMRRLGAMSDKELSEAQSNYARNAGDFDVNGKDTDALFGMSRKVDEETIKAKTGLQRGAAGVIESFTDNTKAATGGMKEYAAETRALTKDLHALRNEVQPVRRDKAHPLGTIANSRNESMIEAAQILGGAHSAATPSAAKAAAKLMGLSEKQAMLAGLDQKNGLPAGFLDAVWNTESARGRRLTSPVGAKGDFQFMDATASQYSVDVSDFVSSANGAGHMYGDLAARYHGDIRKALAAYNWGMGHLDRDVAQFGNQWESHLPQETRKYIDKITSAVAQRSPQTVHVKVENHTAARVAVSTNAASVGS